MTEKVLFANPPWYKAAKGGEPGWLGIRAGSRWAYMKETFGSSLVATALPFPFFLAIAGAMAKNEGLEVCVRDSIVLGETYDDFYAAFKDYSPDFYVMETATPCLGNDLDICKQLKKIKPGITIILTGIHSELEDIAFLQEQTVVDYIVYGEYEQAVTDLLVTLRDGKDLAGIPNLIYRHNGQVIKNAIGEPLDMAKLPWPLRDTLPNESYYADFCGLAKPQLQIHSSRGCPFGCIFCVWPQVLYKNGKHRLRDVDDIAAEIKDQLAKHDYKSIFIDDDTFNVRPDHVKKVAKMMKENGFSSLMWGTMSRPDLMTEELLHELKAANIYSMNYGLESASTNILKNIEKGMNVEQAVKMIKLTYDLGIKIHLTFTIGHPGDTRETIEDTIRLACELPAHSAQFSIATPFPGTKMYEIYKEKGWLTGKGWDAYNGFSSAVIRTETLTGEDLEELRLEAMRRWRQSIAIRSVNSAQFAADLKNTLGELPQGSRVVVLQSAMFAFTREIVKTLLKTGYDIHLFSHERFAGEFKEVLGQENIHIFNEAGNFDQAMLKQKAAALKEKHGFSGAIVPYSNLTGVQYGQAHKVAEDIGGRILAGIASNGHIYPGGSPCVS